MRRSWLKLGIPALLAVLMVGSVFAGVVAAQPGKGNVGDYKFVDSLYQWADYYYNNPGRHSAEIKGELLTVYVTKRGTVANVKIKYRDSKNREINNHLKIEKINNVTYRITENGQRSYTITNSSIGSGEIGILSTPNQLSFSYYVGSNGYYAGSDSDSQCLGLQTWEAMGRVNTSTHTGMVEWDGPSVYLVDCIYPAGFLNVNIEVTDDKGFQLQDTSDESSWRLFYPYTNTNTWVSVSVVWNYFIIVI